MFPPSLLSIFLGLTATANAFPTIQQRRDAGITAPKSEEFSLAMSVNSTYVSLTAVYNGTADLVLQAGRMSAYPGTPAYVNTTGTASDDDSFPDSIVFDLTDSTTFEPGLYGAAVTDLGDLHGASANVFAVKDYQEFEFAVDGTVGHELTAAPQNWFACSDTVNGEASTVLRWGVFASDGSSPVGCTPTTVIQNFNVPGGATS